MKEQLDTIIQLLTSIDTRLASVALTKPHPPVRLDPPQRDAAVEAKIDDVLNHWASVCRHQGKVTARMRSIVRERLKEGSTVAELKEIASYIATEPFYFGDNDRKTPYYLPKTIYRSHDRVVDYLARARANGGNQSGAYRRAEDETPVRARRL